ncbi:MAG: HAD-IG family 5'-nucleotidase [Polyangiaceae bacterium]|nr:HAD-IG family 5'-nucleotidase [Polyangiaceae bacterium]MCW5791696.1 HAD-IG family 5'-nucleotidase [Polyangiaceae bacterium]
MRSDPHVEPTQLLLPLPGLAEPTRDVRIPRADRVFVNRNLAMAGIEWVGFDMDYTLAIYHQRAMDMLSIELSLTRLLAKGYPEYLRQVHYDTRFPIRGLLIDKRFGHVLKMDRYKSVFRGYHGLKSLPPELLERLYHDRKIRPTTPRYHFIDTLFAMCEVTLYSVAVDALERSGDSVDYGKLFEDIRESIDEAHRDGSVYTAITRDLPKYLDRDPGLAKTLHKLRSAGKKLFVLTNSPLSYTQAVMSYLLDGASAEYPSWRHFFDVVVVSAEKPRWFREGRPLKRLSAAKEARNGQAERCQIYEGGSLHQFERLVRAIGPRVLYVGDHIYGDILRSKKESSWRTAMIIQELDQEVAALESCLGEMARQRDLAVTRDQLEDELRFYQARFKELSKERAPDDDVRRVKRALERVRSELRALDQEHTRLSQIIDVSFHPYWGSLLKEHHEMSSFGLQVDTYADLYARRVSSFGAYSAHQHFRSPHDLMPHEL